MTNLTAHHLRFTLKVETPIELDRQQGSAFRGMLFNGLRGPSHNPALGFCTQRHLSACAECALVAVCPTDGLLSRLGLRERDDGVRCGGAAPLEIGTNAFEIFGTIQLAPPKAGHQGCFDRDLAGELIDDREVVGLESVVSAYGTVYWG